MQELEARSRERKTMVRERRVIARPCLGRLSEKMRLRAQRAFLARILRAIEEGRG